MPDQSHVTAPDIPKETQEAAERSQNQNQLARKSKSERVEALRRATASKTLAVSEGAIAIARSTVPIGSAKSTMLSKVDEKEPTLKAMAQLAAPFRSALDGMGQGLQRHMIAEQQKDLNQQAKKNENSSQSNQGEAAPTSLEKAFQEISSSFKAAAGGAQQRPSRTKRNDGMDF